MFFCSLADNAEDADYLTDFVFLGPRGPWFFLDEKGVPAGVMVSVVRLL